MSITVNCDCGKRYQLSDAMAGKKVKCRDCDKVISVPAALAAPTAVAPDPNRMLELLDDLDRRPARVEVEPEEPLVRVPSGGYEASNPGGFEIDFHHYFSCNKSLFIVIGGGLILAAALVPFAPTPVPIIIAISMVWLGVSETFNLRQKARRGDVNPGIVVSLKPPLVAVLTDLCITGQETRPALKILHFPAARMAGGPPTLAMQLPTVSLYRGRHFGSVWQDFEPDVANCMTTDLRTIERLRRSISPREWESLEQALAALAEKKPGLYRLWKPGWNKDATIRINLSPLLKALGIVIVVGTVVLIGLFILIAVVGNWLVKRPARPNFQPPPPIQRPAPDKMRPPPARNPRPGPGGVPPGGVNPPAPGFPVKVDELKAGDRLLVQSENRWLMATVVRVEEDRAFIHYVGPKDKADEWVTPDRMRQLRSRPER